MKITKRALLFVVLFAFSNLHAGDYYACQVTCAMIPGNALRGALVFLEKTSFIGEGRTKLLAEHDAAVKCGAWCKPRMRGLYNSYLLDGPAMKCGYLNVRCDD